MVGEGRLAVCLGRHRKASSSRQAREMMRKSFQASCTREGVSAVLCMELMEASGRRRRSFSSVIWSGLSSDQGRFTA